MQLKHQSITGVDDVFRRVSFGNNAKKDSVLSALVALGLILNYLNIKNNSRLIPEILMAEMLQGSTWSSSKYPRTHQFQKELHRLFGLKTKSPDLWGNRFADKFNRGWLSLYWVSKIFVHCTFAGVGRDKTWQIIVDEVIHSRPTMAIMRSVTLDGAQSRFYAMAVCGYRINSSGKRELMVHSGQYGDPNVRGSRAQIMYVPVDQAICAYRFNVLVKGISKEEFQGF